MENPIYQTINFFKNRDGHFIKSLKNVITVSLTQVALDAASRLSLIKSINENLRKQCRCLEKKIPS
ncbi:CLUMA_CG016922, isoform A [Clunio marinus]|uniref:CLUMA_CG016922, isoform A n=1 Tax=Clunio marinus TaxID=568069 RepID=A0A1J1IV42_9DIPT|nr:CLUMA_CG016922, isoform A [Clunio marinus]